MAKESQEEMQMQMKGFFLGGRHAGVVMMVTNQEEESNVVSRRNRMGRKGKLQNSMDLLRQKLGNNSS